MSEDRERQLKLAMSVGLISAELFLLCWFLLPGFRWQVKRSAAWLRWYGWRARWHTMPGYLKEALEVRGVEPPR